MTQPTCIRCGDAEDDHRTLLMACYYDMNELGIPFEWVMLRRLDETSGNGQLLYTLRVCKNCRGSWMAAIKDWFDNVKPAAESPGTGIFVRKFGATVEITEEEWKENNPGEEPFRFRKEPS